MIAIDKELTKHALVAARHPHARRPVVSSASLYEADPLPRPYVVKPVNEGSSVGVAIVTDDGNYGNPIGRDVDGPVAAFRRAARRAVHRRARADRRGARRDEALAVTELIPESGFYDYDAKYTDGLTTHVCPADIPAEVEAAALDMAARAHPAARLPRRVARPISAGTTEQGVDGLYLLEVNTQPGMTPLSLVPEQAKLSRASTTTSWSAGSLEAAQ